MFGRRFKADKSTSVQDRAAALIRIFGAGAYSEARDRENVARGAGELIEGQLADHWQQVRLEIARRIGRPVGFIAAKRVLRG